MVNLRCRAKAKVQSCIAENSSFRTLFVWIIKERLRLFNGFITESRIVSSILNKKLFQKNQIVLEFAHLVDANKRTTHRAL
ncbi:MAG: hypothetical protein JWN60_884 [Acidobacteria bacterium]|nr:hypothetical protein [Acidobacteriota bacterium]